MWIAKVDASGNPVLDENGKVILVQVPDVDVEAEKRAATAAARAAAQADIAAEKKERERLEKELEERDKKIKEAQLAALPPDQQVAERVRALESNFETRMAQEKAQRLQDQANYQAGLRRMEMVAYRERAVRDVPPEVEDLVEGHDDVSIDQSVDRAKTVYARLREKFFAEAQAQSQSTVLPRMEMPPQNPAWVPPPGFQGGFPVVVNPQSVPVDEGGGDPTAALRNITTEAAVRTGRYSGEVRERIHAQLRGVPYQGNIGNAPRHWSQQQAPQVPQMPLQAMPGGVLQPQGLPTPQYHNPQQQQYAYNQQQLAAQHLQPTPAALSRAAADRTHQGANPHVAADPAAQALLQQSHNFAAQRGIPSPSAAFQARFQNTPPIAPNGQGN